MKALLFSFALLFVSNFAQAAPKADCYDFDKIVTVEIGWFGVQKYDADSLCLVGDYSQNGWTKVSFNLGLKGKVVAVYAGDSERYSATDMRLTLDDGEPEPTQFNTKMLGDKLVQVTFTGRAGTSTVNLTPTK